MHADPADCHETFTLPSHQPCSTPALHMQRGRAAFFPCPKRSHRPRQLTHTAETAFPPSPPQLQTPPEIGPGMVASKSDTGHIQMATLAALMEPECQLPSQRETCTQQYAEPAAIAGQAQHLFLQDTSFQKDRSSGLQPCRQQWRHC